MFRGLLTSFVGHALLLGWALITIHRTPELPPTVTIEATIITPSELTRLKKGDPQSKHLEAKAKDEEPKEVSKKEADKPKPLTAPPPPAPEPPAEEDPIADKLAALPPPKGPSAEEKAALAEKLKQEQAAAAAAEAAEKAAAAKAKAAAEKKKKEEARKKAEAKRKAEEKKRKEAERKKKLAEAKRKAAEAKKKFDADKIAALIDKSPEKRGAPRTSTPPTKPTDYTGPTAGERQGNDTVLSAREQDLLKAMINGQLQPCSKMPGGGGGIDTPVVTVRFQLRPDGSLAGEPMLINRQSSPLYNIAADASIRAIKQCAPFNLPPDKYGAWNTVTWEFDWPVILGIVQR